MAERKDTPLLESGLLVAVRLLLVKERD